MLITTEAASKKIRAGEVLMVAGDQALLAQLPRGTWIGGSIPYFIAEEGGVETKSKVFVTEMPSQLFTKPVVTAYTVKTIEGIARDAGENDVTLLIVPAGSPVLLEYAQKAPNFPSMFLTPIVGWVSGTALDDIGKVPATVTNGLTGEVFTDRALALRCTLPAGKAGQVGIVNIFRPGTGDDLEFPEDSFVVHDVLVNGQRKNFAGYLKEKAVDTQLPLVADLDGTLINVSFQAVEGDLVKLYAPVFRNQKHRLASSVGDYSQAFNAALQGLAPGAQTFSCNCILNYLYGGLEGKRTGSAQGPVTFGEIAYQLVNQTFVYLEVQ